MCNKKRMFNKTGLIDEEMTVSEDWDFFFRLGILYDMHNIKEILIMSEFTIV